jgi:subtilisin family serine protease
MSSLRHAVPLAALVLAAVATGATAAPSAKFPAATPATPGDRAAAIQETGGFARVAPGPRRILVTFADTPRRAVAERRLSGLGSIVPALPEAGIWTLTPSDPATAREAALRRQAVVAAEWSLARDTSELPRPAPPVPPGPPPAFSDPLLTSTRQWSITQGGSTWGTDLTVTGPRPRIAILDTGVDADHEEWSGPGTPLVAPRSTVRRSNDADDWAGVGHGTHVAGIAAAPANGVGIVGVAPGRAGVAEVIPVQIADREGRSSDDATIRGVRHAVLNGAKVINISSGGPGYSRAFQDAVLWATQRGALIVASVGNEGDGENGLNYPAAYPRVLGVGAQCDGQLQPDCPVPYGVAGFSNHNRSVDVIAPGVNIISSVPPQVQDRVAQPGYALKDGTSMAAPYVTGVAALVLAANPDGLSPWQVLRQIENTARDVGPRGRDLATGAGVVNPRAAVTLLAPADDPGEVNDDVMLARGTDQRLAEKGSFSVEASVDRDDDPDDVLAVNLRRGEQLQVSLKYGRGRIALYLWKPGTSTVTADQYRRGDLLRSRHGAASTKTITYRAERTGRHYVDVFAQSGEGPYTLTITRVR